MSIGTMLASTMFDGLTIKDGALREPSGFRQLTHSLRDASASVDLGADLSRFTATRIALLGPFALAFKKKKTQAFLTITSPDFAIVREVSNKDQVKARIFAAAVNRAAAEASR